MSVNLYIHFPYCLYKCHYCDFNSYAWEKDKIPGDEYVHALIQELELRFHLFQSGGSHFLSEGPLQTLFIGGGTPSLLSASQIERLLEGVHRYFRFTSETEITLEANPKTIDLSTLRSFKMAGINRVSVGIQSLHDQYLKKFGRIHTAQDALQALEAISHTDFHSWNADLIYGFPDQTLEQWQADLSDVIKWSPPHLSCYALTLEKETILDQMVKQGRLNPPSDEIQTEMLLYTREHLRSHHYKDYEISNFAKSHHTSKHNVNYWNYGSYLGLGAGAVSFFHSKDQDPFGYRTLNFKKPQAYISAVNEKKTFFEQEMIDRRVAQGEFMMMGLRLKDGIDLRLFESYFGSSIENIFQTELNQYRQKGWITQDAVALTDNGLLQANQVMMEFFE